MENKSPRKISRKVWGTRRRTVFLGALLSRKCTFTGSSAGTFCGDCLSLRVVRTEVASGDISFVIQLHQQHEFSQAPQLERALEGPSFRTISREQQGYRQCYSIRNGLNLQQSEFGSINSDTDILHIFRTYNCSTNRRLARHTK
jgi:hypothetical protein